MLHRRRAALLVAASLAAAAVPIVLAVPSSAATSTTELVIPGLAASGTTSTSVSADGRFVAVRSTEALSAGFADGNTSGADAFLVDRQAGTVRLVSGSDGSTTQGVNADVLSVQISDDGSVVVFQTAASNVVTTAGVVGTTVQHVYRWEAAGNTVELLDVDRAGTPSDGAEMPRADADGSRVAFETIDAAITTNAAVTDANGTWDVVVRDVASDTTTLLSHVAGNLLVAANGTSNFVSTSADGTTFAFVSDAEDLVAGMVDGFGQGDVFRTTLNGATQLVSHTAQPVTAPLDPSDDAVISANGRFVVFESHSDDLDDNVTTYNVDGLWSADDVYVWDGADGSIELVSAAVGTPAVEADDASGTATTLGTGSRMVSDDGRYVLFATTASNVAAVDDPNNDGWDVFVRDRTADVSIPVSVSVTQTPTPPDLAVMANSGVVEPGAPLDGSPTLSVRCDVSTGYVEEVRVAFASQSVDLVASPTVSGVNGYLALVEPDAPRDCSPPPTTTTTTAPPTTTTTTTPPPPPPPPPPAVNGYWMLSDAGDVYSFGNASPNARADGPAASAHQVVDIVEHPDGAGYWILASDGTVWAKGTATLHGGAPVSLLAGERATGISTTPHGAGYWVFTDRGRVFPFGGASSFGDLASVPLNGPVLDAVGTPSGQGYYMVGSDGGVFAFGDADFYGSTGNLVLNRPVRGLVPTASNQGYWLIADDGGIFAFGDAPFLGSMGATPLNQPVVGAVRFGEGYLMVARDGGIFNFSSQQFYGSLGGNPPPNPIVAVAPSP
jgi:hypothetical protein